MSRLPRIILIQLVVLAASQLWFFGSVDAQGGNSYSTNFPGTENPISEGGRWMNGATVGLDWKNVQTRPGLAYGADPSGNPNFNDPTAILTGTWGPTQTVQATVYSVNQQTGNINEEVELRLRSTMTPHSSTGYEILFRCNHDGGWYTDIVRWNGPLGNFTPLSHLGLPPGIFNGDVVKATIVGNVIKVYINNVQINTATDSTFTSGNPGMGFYLHNGANLNADFGFTTYSASDGGTVPPPAAPTNVRIIKGMVSASPTPEFGTGVLPGLLAPSSAGRPLLAW